MNRQSQQQEDTIDNSTAADGATATLAAEREIYSVITKNMAEGICLVRLSDGVIVYANPKFEQMFGYSLSELSGKHIWIVNDNRSHSSAQETYDRIAEQVVESGEAIYEVQNVRKDGTPFWCEVTASICEHPQYGAVLVAVQQDITKRKQAEQALRASERRFRAVFNQTFQFMGLLQPDGTVIEVNQTALDFAELRAANVVGRPFWQTYWWTISPAAQAQLQTAIVRAAAGAFVRYEANILGAAGIVAIIDFSLKPIQDEDGVIRLLIAEGRDITQRKNAEAKVHKLNAELEERVALRTEQLTDSRQRLATLAEVSPVGIFRADETGAAIYVNDRWCEITGLSRDEIFSNGSIRALHPDDYARVRQEWKQAIAHSAPFKSEFRFCHPDGSIVWVFCQAIPDTSTEDGAKLSGYVGTITDISDRKQAELALQERAAELAQLNALLENTAATLEERNRELDQFAYVASHDLKAPLRAIANLSQWIEEDLQGQLPPENQRQMELLRSRVRRMEELLDGLLQFSRVGRVQTRIASISVGQLLTDVIDSLAPPASFAITIAPTMPTLATRSLLLQQVFANLISNAIKHHDRPDGRVTISVQEWEDAYEFAVSDDGPGIAPEFHDRIFTIFQTLGSPDTKENTGVGLSIVKKIVETEGGKIWVESELGRGTCFRFTWLKQAKLALNDR